MKTVFVCSLLLCFVVGASLLMISGCSLDFVNPNSPTEEAVTTTAPGIMGLAIGMQQLYSTTVLQAMILTPGLTSREVAVNRTFSDLIELETGGTGVSDVNANLLTLWANALEVVSIASQLQEHAPLVPMDNGTRSGILSLSYLYKAMALGCLAESFEQAPIDVSSGSPPQFKPKNDVLVEALRLLGLAAQTIKTTPVSTEFTTKVLSSGFSLQNTISAYQARYNLMVGNYQQAIDAANATSPTATSKFVYDAKSQNPIYAAVTGLGRWAPMDLFGTSLTDPKDARLAFYMAPPKVLSVPGNFPIQTLTGFFNDPVKPIPVYLPGELRLIRAEAYVRLGNLASAVTEINAIRTKTAAQDPFGVGAALPVYSGAVTSDALLQEIYAQRCAELFWSGLRLEDSRRLGRPGPTASPSERNRNFYPYPAQERVNNPNTPANPAI
jgi:starch-binding outer membrane protein, SusD/RagB family